ncbi:radical SAM protein [Rhodococcus sp. MEB064]|uniref:radical SAM protein n=1 Tax=Rhodococcus sp. MEB064 TaxID=1587522 RepID=UPI0009E39A9A|nr:radical SAM protein [Rhodococcus sp. MEB064]
MSSDPLNLLAKLEQPELRAFVQSARVGTAPANPVVIDLDPTTFCNLGCAGCISENLLNADRFTKVELTQLAADIASLGVLGVVFSGGGEPLAHPATVDAMKILHNSGVRIGLVTNGTVLGGRIGEIAQYCSWIRVSVDAATQATFDALRPPRKGSVSQFDTVIRGMRALNSAGAALLGYSFVVNPGRLGSASNIEEIPLAIDLADEIGCDYIEFKSYMQEDHHLWSLTADELSSIRESVTSGKKRSDLRLQVHLSSNLTDAIAGKSLSQYKNYDQCAVSTLRTVVTPTGMYPCGYHRGSEQWRMGNPRQSSLSEVWKTAHSREMPVPSRDCNFYCARHESNLAIMQFSDRVGLIPREERDFDPFI